jgi:hypothetical protein
MQSGPLKNLLGKKPFEDYKDFKTPFFVVNGGSDRLVDPRVGFDLINTSSVSKSDK